MAPLSMTLIRSWLGFQGRDIFQGHDICEVEYLKNGAY